MKNAFYLVLKALSILEIFKFLSRLFGHVGIAAWLEKDKVNFEIMMSQPGFQTIAIHILPNISESKGNQWNLVN